MRLTAKLKSKDNFLVFEPFGNTERLLCEKVYDLNIKDYKSSRSLEQNKMLWGLVQAISKETQNDEMDIYIAGLEHCNAKSEFIVALPETEQSLKKVFRAVKAVGKSFLGLQEAITYQCWLGSSKFNVEEMTQLIQYFKDLAQELGIESEEQ